MGIIIGVILFRKPLCRVEIDHHIGLLQPGERPAGQELKELHQAEFSKFRSGRQFCTDFMFEGIFQPVVDGHNLAAGEVMFYDLRGPPSVPLDVEIGVVELIQPSRESDIFTPNLPSFRER